MGCPHGIVPIHSAVPVVSRWNWKTAAQCRQGNNRCYHNFGAEVMFIVLQQEGLWKDHNGGLRSRLTLSRVGWCFSTLFFFFVPICLADSPGWMVKSFHLLRVIMFVGRSMSSHICAVFGSASIGTNNSYYSSFLKHELSYLLRS